MTSREELNLLLIDERHRDLCLTCPLAECVWIKSRATYLCPIEQQSKKGKPVIPEMPEGYLTLMDVAQEINISYSALTQRLRKRWHTIPGIRRHFNHKLLIPASQVEWVAEMVELRDF